MTDKRPDWYHYVIYRHPIDHPHHHVCRRFKMAENPIPDPHPLMVGSLEQCRAAIPSSHAKMDRHPSDLHHILETWI